MKYIFTLTKTKSRRQFEIHLDKNGFSIKKKKGPKFAQLEFILEIYNQMFDIIKFKVVQPFSEFWETIGYSVDLSKTEN